MFIHFQQNKRISFLLHILNFCWMVSQPYSCNLLRGWDFHKTTQDHRAVPLTGPRALWSKAVGRIEFQARRKALLGLSAAWGSGFGLTDWCSSLLRGRWLLDWPSSHDGTEREGSRTAVGVQPPERKLGFFHLLWWGASTSYFTESQFSENVLTVSK